MCGLGSGRGRIDPWRGGSIPRPPTSRRRWPRPVPARSWRGESRDSRRYRRGHRGIGGPAGLLCIRRVGHRNWGQWPRPSRIHVRRALRARPRLGATPGPAPGATRVSTRRRPSISATVLVSPCRLARRTGPEATATPSTRRPQWPAQEQQWKAWQTGGYSAPSHPVVRAPRARRPLTTPQVDPGCNHLF